MRRFFLIPVMLCISLSGLAQPLYKWIESDGSITFSPKPPPDGTQYEIVDTGSKRQQPDSDQSATVAADTELTIQQSPVNPKYSANLPSIQPTVNKRLSATSRLADVQTGAALPTPESGPPKAPVTPTIERGSESGIVHRRGHPDVAGGNQGAVVLSTKDRQCRDLQKRVISLEHRLRSSLNAEDMDNTVVHMARYQRSINQYCGQ